jgi:hypothetical protein
MALILMILFGLQDLFVVPKEIAPEDDPWPAPRDELKNLGGYYS